MTKVARRRPGHNPAWSPLQADVWLRRDSARGLVATFGRSLLCFDSKLLFTTLFCLKTPYFRRQRILGPPLVLILQGEADGDGFGSQFVLKHDVSLKRLSFQRQRILRPCLVLIFQGEGDGDGFVAKFLINAFFL